MIDSQIASYHPADQQALFQFLQAEFTALGHQFAPASKDADLREIPTHYQSNGGLFLLAKQHGQLIGTIALRRIAPDIAELKRFYVRPDRQRNGLGTSLLNRAIAHAKANHFSRIRLDTTHKSQSAISLFKKHGFVEIERYHPDPLAEIFMELRLL